MNEKQIKHMVERFLQWKLPPDFSPDNGINFDAFGSKGTEHQFRREPVGTNLFSSSQADQMVRFMTTDFPNE